MSNGPDFYVYEWNDGREGGSVARSLSPSRANFGRDPDRVISVYGKHEELMLDANEKIAWLVLHLTHHHSCIHTRSELTGIRKWLGSSPGSFK